MSDTLVGQKNHNINSKLNQLNEGGDGDIGNKKRHLLINTVTSTNTAVPTFAAAATNSNSNDSTIRLTNQRDFSVNPLPKSRQSGGRGGNEQRDHMYATNNAGRNNNSIISSSSSSGNNNNNNGARDAVVIDDVRDVDDDDEPEDEDDEIQAHEPRPEVGFFKDWLLFHLDLIQQQNDDILAKEQEILLLKQDNERLKERLNLLEAQPPTGTKHQSNAIGRGFDGASVNCVLSASGSISTSTTPGDYILLDGDFATSDNMIPDSALLIEPEEETTTAIVEEDVTAATPNVSSACSLAHTQHSHSLLDNVQHQQYLHQRDNSLSRIEEEDEDITLNVEDDDSDDAGKCINQHHCALPSTTIATSTPRVEDKFLIETSGNNCRFRKDPDQDVLNDTLSGDNSTYSSNNSTMLLFRQDFNNTSPNSPVNNVNNNSGVTNMHESVVVAAGQTVQDVYGNHLHHNRHNNHHNHGAKSVKFGAVEGDGVTRRKRLLSSSSALSNNNDSNSEECRHKGAASNNNGTFTRRCSRKKRRKSAIKCERILTCTDRYVTLVGADLRVPPDHTHAHHETATDQQQHQQQEEDNSPLSIDVSRESARNLEVPHWRVKVYTSCYSMEGTENLDDDVYNKRHSRLENDERRRKRWDVQRIREQRIVDKLKQRQERTSTSLTGTQTETEPPLESLWPSLEDIKCLEISDELPVSAFGCPVPRAAYSDFSLPWLNNPHAHHTGSAKKARKNSSSGRRSRRR